MIHESVLDERLAALERARVWSPRLVSKLEALIRSGDEASLYAMNPLRFAADKNIAENEAVDLFLVATKLGLFEMNWELLCPLCGDMLKSFGTLKTLHSHVHCSMCQCNTEAALDDYIRVSFTVGREVRETRFHRPERLAAREYALSYRFSRECRTRPGGPPMPDWLGQVARFCEYLEPGAGFAAEVSLEPGTLIFHDLLQQRAGAIRVEAGAPRLDTIAFRFTPGGVDPPMAVVAPGPVRIAFDNGSATRVLALAFSVPPGHRTEPKVFDPFLTGKRVLVNQTFRDLYRSEVIDKDEGIAVKDLTLLFTDLKQSTEMYDRVGDLKAYTLVRQHFDSLSKVIAARHGVIVKTIGDAVMAAFLNPRDAVLAATEMLREIEAFNRSLGSDEIILKIGIHKGAAIAVTLNERLDYFGQAVNIAARVQGLADAREIYLTEDAYAFEGVAAALEGFEVAAKMAQLKGVQEQVRVYRVAAA